MQLVVIAAGAMTIGLVAHRYRLPGGALIGSMLGAAAVSLLWGSELVLPPAFRVIAFSLVGLTVGIGATRQTLGTLRPLLVPAIGSAVALIGAGYGTAKLLESLAMAPPSAVLATSPGALSVLIAVALDVESGEAEVAFFHLIRIMLVIILIPLIVPSRPGHAGD